MSSEPIISHTGRMMPSFAMVRPSGVPECIWRGAQLGVRIVPGVELDCRRREQDFLVLGLGIDITCPVLLEMERSARENPVQPPFTAEQALGLIRMAGGRRKSRSLKARFSCILATKKRMHAA